MARRFANSPAGIRELLNWARSMQTARVLFEASGAYHRLLEGQLVTAGLGGIKVNPLQARRFAEATGQRAKTDRTDAAVLARMGTLLELPSRPPMDEYQHALHELYMGRLALIKDQTAAKNRLKTVSQTILRRQILARLKQITRQIEEIDTARDQAMRQDGVLRERLDILTSIPGVGRTTAIAILIEMPEIGALNGKKVASLAGAGADDPPVGPMERKRPNSGRTRRAAKGHLHAGPGRDRGAHAKTRRARKLPDPQWSEMDATLILTKTDTSA
jgi:transposase